MTNQTRSFRSWLVPGLFLACGALAIFCAAHAKAQSLGSAETFAVLGATTVTNTGPSQISGSVGVSPGSAITGFPPGIVITGTGGIHASDATATQAHADLASAYTAFVNLASVPANNLSGTDLGGKTLTPGVYKYDTSATSGGVLTFDAQNNPNARFVIQIGTTLITTGSSSVALINGANAQNIYFQVGTSVTLGGGSTFIGNLLANVSITTVGNTTVTGRLLAVTGAVTLDTNTVTSPGLTPAHLMNISTRASVLTGDNVLIGGFIVTGSGPKKVILRAIGPSLSGINPVLADPVLELHGSNGSLITSNDNWKATQQIEIQNTGLAPANDLESAIVATLAPGNYTAIVTGKNGTTGIGLVEVYDLDRTAGSKLGNISSRGFVGINDEVMIAGFIFAGGTASEKVIIRVLGPSLAGIANVLVDPTVELHDGNGTLLIADDNWQDDPSQKAQIIATGLAPSNNLESAIVTTLPPGNYTALVAGKNGGTGVALVEVYHLSSN